MLIIAFSCAYYEFSYFCLNRFLSINCIDAIVSISGFFNVYKQKGVSSFRSFKYFSAFKCLSYLLLFFMKKDDLIRGFLKLMHFFIYFSQIITFKSLYVLTSFFDLNSDFNIRFAANIKHKKKHSLIFNSYKDHLAFLLAEKNLDYCLSYLWFFFFYFIFELVYYLRSFGLDLAISRFFSFFSFGGGVKYLINFLRIYFVFICVLYVFIFFFFSILYCITLFGAFLETFSVKLLKSMYMVIKWFSTFTKNIYNSSFYYCVNYVYAKDVAWLQSNNKFDKFSIKNVTSNRFYFESIHKDYEYFQNNISFFNIYLYIFKRYWLILSFFSFFFMFFSIIIYYSLNDLYMFFFHLTDIFQNCSFFYNIIFEDHCYIYIGYTYIDKIQTRYFWEGIPVFYDTNIYIFYFPLNAVSTMCTTLLYIFPLNFICFPFQRESQILTEMQFNLAVSVISFEGLYIFFDVVSEHIRALNSEIFSVMFKQVFEEIYSALSFISSIIYGWLVFPLFELLKFLFLCWVDGSYILYIQPLIYIFGPAWFEDITTFFCAGDFNNFTLRLYEFLIKKVFLLQKIFIYIFFVSLFFHLFLFIFSFLDDYFYNSIYKIYFFICFLYVFMYYWFYSSINYIFYLDNLVYIYSIF